MRKVLYLDIVNDIQAQIEHGELKPGDVLPPEHELSEYYGVSRTTLRKSLALLINRNFIYSIPGKGNYVSEPKISAYQFYFDEIDSLKGEVDEVRLLSVKGIRPGRKLMRALDVHTGDKVLKVEKLVIVSGRPAEYMIVYLPYVKGDPIIEDVIHFANFHGLLQKSRLQFQLDKSFTLEVIRPNYHMRRQLQCDPEEGIIFIHQTIVSVDSKQPISYNEYYIKSDYFVLDAKTLQIK